MDIHADKTHGHWYSCEDAETATALKRPHLVQQLVYQIVLAMFLQENMTCSCGTVKITQQVMPMGKVSFHTNFVVMKSDAALDYTTNMHMLDQVDM